MSIFNIDKSKNDSKQDITLEDYEKKIQERNEEYRRLNEILHGMRNEVSKLMEEIKQLSDELVKKNAEVFLVDQKLEDLKRNYHLLQQNIEDEQNIFISLRNNIEKIKDEIKTDLAIQDELIKIKNEYDLISLQVAEKKEELLKLQAENTTSPSKENNNDASAVLTSSVSSEKKLKRCKAKTKNGSKCKRFALENSDFCSIHSKNVKVK